MRYCCFLCSASFPTIAGLRHHLQVAYTRMYHDHTDLLESPLRADIPPIWRDYVSSIHNFFSTSKDVAREMGAGVALLSEHGFDGDATQQRRIEASTAHIDIPQCRLSPFVIVPEDASELPDVYSPYTTSLHAHCCPGHDSSGAVSAKKGRKRPHSKRSVEEQPDTGPTSDDMDMDVGSHDCPQVNHCFQARSCFLVRFFILSHLLISLAGRCSTSSRNSRSRT
jgi:hypothetical protein